ncbi:MAG: lipopolysaccharide heptosyltransferase family protein [Rhodospirillales bacterium]|nr:lipopolysaccharide heptosyltransferase family protein [Rhodospirillales bacterium]MSP79665.1 lipopolysaccharide heptosyltransferase family protein [Rhodospirillales bacterium]
MNEPARKILVIKLGALGDFVQALNACAFIRRHYESDRIVLLTTATFADLARASGLFDDIELDARPKAHQGFAWLANRRFLRAGRFTRAYDLQTSDRSSFYFRLFWPGPYPEWSGIAPGCSHPHTNPGRDLMHTLDRQAEQLRMAGINEAEARPPDVSFLHADTSRFGLGPRYALLVPGGAAHRPDKRWPPERFAAVATELAGSGVAPVLLGIAREAPLTGRIRALCPAAVDLAGRTGFADIAALARHAAGAIGNDTGPMHLIAATGCPSVVLFSAASDPALCAPRGSRVTALRRDPLAALGSGEVLGALRGFGVVS